MRDLNVIDSDRQFAADILEDMGNFEEGITDLEKLAQWVRNVRHAAEKKVAAQPQSPWMPIETAPFVSAKRYLIVNGSEIPLIGFRYYEHGPWYDEHGHEVNPLAWQELSSYSVSRPLRDSE